MAHLFHKKKKAQTNIEPVEINVTPMLDMFSVLNSFLLMTAVFSAIGMTRVEIPFLSSAPPPSPMETPKPEPKLVVIVDTESFKLEIGNTVNSDNIVKHDFTYTPESLDKFQATLYAVRTENRQVDKVEVMVEKDASYERLIQVIDYMRVLRNNRAPIPFDANYEFPQGVERDALIPKIVLGSVIL